MGSLAMMATVGDRVMRRSLNGGLSLPSTRDARMVVRGRTCGSM
jgi:hypothetical protein